MLTWRIHRTLDDPLKRDPISWRGYEGRFAQFIPTPRSRFNHLKPITTAALFVAASPVVGMILILFFFPSPILALMLSNIFGLQTAERLSGYIAGEHRRRTYDLICSLPYGKLGVHWVYAARWFWATRFTRMGLRVPLIMGLIASPFLFGGWLYPLTGQRAVYFWFVDTAALAVYMLYEYFNTRVIAVLVAILTPALTPKTRTIYALSVGVYLLIQVSSYLLGALIALALLPEVLARLNAPFVASIVIAPITAAVVISFREAITRWLWRLIGNQLNTPDEELESYVY